MTHRYFTTILFQRIGEAINSDTVPRKVLEFGRGLIMRNVLTGGKQIDVKEQIVGMEEKLETLKNRAREDIDRYAYVSMPFTSATQVRFLLSAVIRLNSTLVACEKSVSSLILPNTAG